MLVKTYGSAVQGIDATRVTIEVNEFRGINFHLVGSPDNAVKRKPTTHLFCNKNQQPRDPPKKDRNQLCLINKALGA